MITHNSARGAAAGNMRGRHAVLLLAAGAALALAMRQPRLAQDPAYHALADQRVFWGIPNCFDVLSNLPFAVAGVWGLSVVFRRGTVYADPWERWPYVALFAGTAATAFGSAYYHLAPDNASLVWDRLPMTCGFMGLLVALLAERASLRLARWLLVPLLLVGVASVLYWQATERLGAGDLRFYLLVQFGSLLLVVLLLLLYPARYSGGGYLAAALACYGLAKLLELADREVFDLGGLVSGHTLKHLAAAAGVGLLVVVLRARRVLR